MALDGATVPPLQLFPSNPDLWVYNPDELPSNPDLWVYNPDELL